jgi:signal transduction histidine kinase
MGDSPVREVEVQARVSSGSVRIEVADSGPGVPPGLDEKIFEPHVRAAETSGAYGIGLGLATVRRLCRAHHGEAALRRPRSGGSAFWVELPVAPPEPRSQALLAHA